MGKHHKNLAVHLTHKRKQAGITQANLAEAVQVSRKSINAIEHGIYVPSTVLSIIETSGSRRGQIELGDNQNVDQGGIGDIHFVGHYQNSGHKDMARIAAVSDGSTSGQRGAYLAFDTKTDGSAAIVERLRLESGGTLFSKSPSDANPNFKFRSDDTNWHGYLNQTVHCL